MTGESKEQCGCTPRRGDHPPAQKKNAAQHRRSIFSLLHCSKLL
jgi:hypothetical protein